MLTATKTQVEALRALKARRLVGVTYFKDDLNSRFAQFFEQGGFEVAAMQGCVNTPFSDLGKIPGRGIGRAIALAFGAIGHAVVITGRTREPSIK